MSAPEPRLSDWRSAGRNSTRAERKAAREWRRLYAPRPKVVAVVVPLWWLVVLLVVMSLGTVARILGLVLL